jgi:RNA-binding protein YhbY
VRELVLHINNRKFINKEELNTLFTSLKDGKYLVRVSSYSRRSLRQNAYYHGVVVPLVRQGLVDAGYDQVTENEEAHEIIKHIFLKREIRSELNDDAITIAGSTAQLTTQKFNDFLGQVIRWAAEYLNVVIPDPNSAYAMLEDYAEELENEA